MSALLPPTHRQGLVRLKRAAKNMPLAVFPCCRRLGRHHLPNFITIASENLLWNAVLVLRSERFLVLVALVELFLLLVQETFVHLFIQCSPLGMRPCVSLRVAIRSSKCCSSSEISSGTSRSIRLGTVLATDPVPGVLVGGVLVVRKGGRFGRAVGIGRDEMQKAPGVRVLHIHIRGDCVLFGVGVRRCRSGISAVPLAPPPIRIGHYILGWVFVSTSFSAQLR